MFEKRLSAIAPKAFISNGTSDGIITLASALGFSVKQKVFLASNTITGMQFEVKKFLSPTQIVVGPVGTSIFTYSDVSAFLVSDSAQIYAAEQPRVMIDQKEFLRAVYAEEPIVAIRTFMVDDFGDPYNLNNPLPVALEGSISIGAVEVKGTNGNFLEPNTDGSINVNVVETPITGQNERSIYNEVLNVASGVETQITSYTVPVGKTSVLHRVVTSGENVARFNLYLNGSPIDVQRTYFGGNFNAQFEFTTGTNSGIILNASDVVSVKVLHTRPFVGSFEARIQVLEIG